ncbi:hypothetical protein GE061_001689 [Apolygus lucorum]|uniref:Uncharacterized protein n=1 Tax=Apolygus lucorum TaxID=248454 RepID=A0A8S9Y9P1_APOLU|nr:hypothetical protein GE061_001688 [Apolygus lucorum]KAF6217335.1 hypothetical protein GE061_001689 [Apolygus lucorum]
MPTGQSNGVVADGAYLSKPPMIQENMKAGKSRYNVLKHWSVQYADTNTPIETPAEAMDYESTDETGTIKDHDLEEDPFGPGPCMETVQLPSGIVADEPDESEDYFPDDREQSPWSLKRGVPSSTSHLSSTTGEAMNATGNADTADGMGFPAPTSTPMKQLESLIGHLRLLGSTRSSVLRKRCVQAALDNVFDVARWIPTYQRILEERDTLIEHQSKLIIDKLVLTRERDMAREKAGTNAGETPETRTDDPTTKEHRADMKTGVRATCHRERTSMPQRTAICAGTLDTSWPEERRGPPPPKRSPVLH